MDNAYERILGRSGDERDGLCSLQSGGLSVGTGLWNDTERRSFDNSSLGTKESEQQEEKTTVPVVTRKGQTESPLPLDLYPPGFDLSGYTIIWPDATTDEWSKELSDLYSSAKMKLQSSEPQSDGPQPENGDGSDGTLGCGFYRVVRNGVHIVGLTNTPLSGSHSFILEVGLDDTSAPVIGFSVGRHDQESLNGLTTSPGIERLQIVWDTAQTSNGFYSLIPEVELADGTVITGAVKTVTVENAISFPNGYQYAGDAMYVQAHTLHTNGTWHIDFYDDQDAYLGFLDGNVSATGYCDYPGIPSPGFSIGLLDNQGNQLQSSYYSVVVTTTPPAPGGITPNGTGGNSSATATNKIVVERRWAGNKWAIAYQTVYPLNSTADLQLYSMMGQIVGGIQEGPYGNHAVINSPYAVTPNPFRLRFTSHWQQLASDLSNDTVRNFIYFGHGSKKSIGSGDVNTSMNREIIQFLLKNSPDPLVGTNRHPYRFVFLDGCDTAKGDLCLDFGIPKQTIYATNMISRYGLRPRAFLGWKTKIGASVKNTLPQTHAKFVSRFF